ncbi:hypothetical protein FSP39_011520 [Pinctada imbricata]|uniref:Uncharacterized protein n=1 Tax=Pinctada imbricata TaxID=66713 RepID=A0AA89C3K9_PINIB|nr:hypothetical protein FSP39_011520 [Pinctada imbricata]
MGPQDLLQPIVYCHSKPPSDRSQPESNAGNHSVLTLNKGKQKDSTNTNYDLDDKSSSASSDSGCETELGNSCHGSRTDCCHGSKASQSVKSNTNSVTNESNTIKSVVESTVKTATVELGVLQDNGLDLQSTCSDMSVSESGDGSISMPNGQEQNTVRQIRPRRKYYMYGNLKLIKPIKDVPKRFLDLLNSMSAEKHRVEGEPIILASPPSGEEHYQEMTTPYTFNPEAQCFVPGSSGTIEGATIANLECSNNASSIPTSISSNSSTANYTMYVLHQPSQSSNPTGSHGNNHPSNSTHLTNGNHSNPQYPCTPLYAGFPSNQGPAGLQMMYLPEQNSLCQQYSA